MSNFLKVECIYFLKSNLSISLHSISIHRIFLIHIFQLSILNNFNWSSALFFFLQLFFLISNLLIFFQSYMVIHSYISIYRIWFSCWKRDSPESLASSGGIVEIPHVLSSWLPTVSHASQGVRFALTAVK